MFNHYITQAIVVRISTTSSRWLKKIITCKLTKTNCTVTYVLIHWYIDRLIIRLILEVIISQFTAGLDTCINTLSLVYDRVVKSFYKKKDIKLFNRAWTIRYMYNRAKTITHKTTQRIDIRKLTVTDS